MVDLIKDEVGSFKATDHFEVAALIGLADLLAVDIEDNVDIEDTDIEDIDLVENFEDTGEIEGTELAEDNEDIEKVDVI